MRQFRLAAYSLGLVLLWASAVPAQTIAPGDAVSGTVIIDGNDFMHAQHMDQLIQSNAQSTIDGLSRMQSLHDSAMNRAMMVVGGGAGGGASGGGAPYVPPGKSQEIDAKVRKLDTFDFAPDSDDVLADLAKKNARGDSAKQEQLTKLYRRLLVKYHAEAGAENGPGRVSRAWTALLLAAYGVNGAMTKMTQDDLTLSIDAFTLFDGALQFQNNHLQSSAQKERIYDTLAITTEMIASEYEIAKKRNDAQLLGKVKSAASSVSAKLFGCSPDAVPYKDCVNHVGIGSTNYLRKNYTAFLQM